MRRDGSPQPLVLAAPQLATLIEQRNPALAEYATRLAQRHPRGLHGCAPAGYQAALGVLASRMIERYGVLDPQDLLRLFAVAVRRGWEFDLGESGAWARAILLDPRTPGPRRRVERLVAELREREAVEHRNRAIDRALSGRRRRS